MSNTILPLKEILLGNYKFLVDALREVAKQDEASVSVHPTLRLETLRKEVLADTHLSPTDFPINQTTIVQQFLVDNHPELSIYDTENPIALFLSDHIFSYIFNFLKPHPELTPQAYKLSLLLCLAFSRRPEAVCDKQHPLRNFVNQLLILLNCWESSPGKIGRAAPELLKKIIDSVATLDIQSNWAISQQTNLISAFNQKNIERSKKLEQRLSEIETADIGIEIQQQKISSWIDKKLNNKLLPIEINAFIRNHLIGDLQYLMIHQGDQCTSWSKWQKLLHLFSWVFKQTDDDHFQKKLYNTLPVTMDELDESYYADMQDPSIYPDFLSLITHIFMGLIRGDKPECEYFIAVGSGNETDNNVVVKQVVIQDASSFNTGDWFLFKNSDQTTLRAKLSVKILEKDSLIFVNYLGKKIYQCSLEDFTLQLAAQTTESLTHGSKWFTKGLHNALKQLEIHHRRNLRLQQQSLDNKESERNKAATKAKTEALVLKQKKDQQKEEQHLAIQQRESLSEADLLEHQSSIEKLQVGAWVSIISNDGQVQRSKLSVKLTSTKKYIFTNRLGQPFGDYYLNDLIDLILADRLTIISNEENFESKLEKIVKGLRKD
jgi:hypothetical protein